MKPYNNSNSMGEVLKPLSIRLGFISIMLGVGIALSSPANAAAPAVGSLISNQASASYTDGSGAIKSATSNAVVTTVTQVAALALVTDNTKTVPTSGGTVYMPHTLTNLGNGTDTYKLPVVDNAVSGNAFSSMQIFLDADGNGVPDSGVALCTGAACANYTTPAIAANDSFKFILALQVPPHAAATPFDTATVTAISQFDTAKTAANTDTVIITPGASFNVTKSISVPSGAASAASCTNTNYSGGTCVKVKYTLTYTNTGAAGPLYLKDIIGSGANAKMQYVVGSARWGATGATVLTEASGDPQSGIDFQVLDGASATFTTGASTPATIQAIIANVPQGFSDTLTFEVGIISDAAPGVAASTTTNTGQYEAPTDASCTTVADCTIGTPTNTNPSPYVVGTSYNVVANNLVSASTDESPDSSATGFNLVSVSNAAPGTTVVFDNYIWNTGTGNDTFDLVLDLPGSTFPSGTTFQMFKSDGATALADSNGGGIADTGDLAPGASYKVVVKAFIPAGACITVSCPTGGHQVKVTATSINDNTKLNNVFDRLTVLDKPSADLTNSVSGIAGDATHGTDQGVWVGGATVPTTTLPVAAGNSAVFDLYVKNIGTAVDNYNLEYSASDFTAGTIPGAGWTVEFRSTTGACTATSGTVITNTGSVAVNAQYHYCAVVSAPVTALAATYNVYFKAVSGATGSSDTKLDAVTIDANKSMVITPNGSNQVFPGGSVVYPHDFKNTGNLDCGVGGTASFTFSVSGVNTGWSIALYEDVNGNGAIDGADTLLVSHNGTAMAPGTNLVGPLTVTGVNSVKKLLAKVIAPAGAASGDTDNILISVVDNSTIACTAPNANDATLVVTGQLRLDKGQVLDSNCDGTETAFVSTPLTAKPGECLIYKVTAVNAGTTNVTAITINDNTPSFTTYESSTAPALVCSSGAASAPADGATGALTCGPIATMIPGQTETMQFVVKVNQ